MYILSDIMCAERPRQRQSVMRERESNAKDERWKLYMIAINTFVFRQSKAAVTHTHTHKRKYKRIPTRFLALILCTYWNVVDNGSAK